jgi:ferredoxin
MNGLVLVESQVEYVGGEECNWCGLCEAICEHDAISCPYEIVIAEHPDKV